MNSASLAEGLAALPENTALRGLESRTANCAYSKHSWLILSTACWDAALHLTGVPPLTPQAENRLWLTTALCILSANGGFRPANFRFVLPTYGRNGVWTVQRTGVRSTHATRGGTTIRIHDMNGCVRLTRFAARLTGTG